MHVTLEVSPADIIKGLSGNSENPAFLQALKMAEEKQKQSQDPFSDLFYQSFKEINPEGKLSTIFANAANRGRISLESSDEEIMQIISKEVTDAIDRSLKYYVPE